MDNQIVEWFSLVSLFSCATAIGLTCYSTRGSGNTKQNSLNTMPINDNFGANSIKSDIPFQDKSDNSQSNSSSKHPVILGSPTNSVFEDEEKPKLKFNTLKSEQEDQTLVQHTTPKPKSKDKPTPKPQENPFVFSIPSRQSKPVVPKKEDTVVKLTPKPAQNPSASSYSSKPLLKYIDQIYRWPQTNNSSYGNNVNRGGYSRWSAFTMGQQAVGKSTCWLHTAMTLINCFKGYRVVEPDSTFKGYGEFVEKECQNLNLSTDAMYSVTEMSKYMKDYGLGVFYHSFLGTDEEWVKTSVDSFISAHFYNKGKPIGLNLRNYHWITILEPQGDDKFLIYDSLTGNIETKDRNCIYNQALACGEWFQADLVIAKYGAGVKEITNIDPENPPRQ